MNKFNPSKVPKWCKWIAVDPSGECYAYSIKPYPSKSVFIEWLPVELGKGKDELLYKGKPPKNWKDELYTWG